MSVWGGPVDVFEAIDRRDWQSVKDAVTPGKANLRDAHHDATLLHWVVNEGDVPTVQHLLACGADVHSRDGKHLASPLHWAAAKGHAVSVRLLLEGRQVDMNSRDSCQRTPMHWAAGNGQLAAIRELLAWGARADCVDMWRKVPLHWAAFRGHVDTVQELLLRGSPIDKPDIEGNTPGSSFHQSVPKPAQKAIQDNVKLKHAGDELQRATLRQRHQEQAIARLQAELEITRTAMTAKTAELQAACENRDTKLRQKAAKEEQRMCVVCLENERSVVLLPCRHLCLCSNCSDRGDLSQCPLCRCRIADKLAVYLS